MAHSESNAIVVTGAHALTVSPGAPLTPSRWAAQPARLARMDRLCALALVACDSALVDGALSPTAPEWDGARTAIVLGTAFGCHATNEEYYRGLRREGPSPRLFAYTLPSSPVGEISIHYGVRGPATTLANGLTSGVDALAAAAAMLAAGRADRVLACAADVATPLLSSLLGGAPLVDAAAALLLERAGDAAARGATPRLRWLGSDAAFDASSPTAALAAAVEGALVAAAATHASAARLSMRRDALGVAPLVALIDWLPTAERGAMALLATVDEGGAGAAAVVAAG